MEARRDASSPEGQQLPASPALHRAILPYPAHLESAVVTRDAAALRIRPIRPGDASMEAAFVGALSDETRYRRFFSGARELTPEAIARFTQVDYDREMALVALHSSPGGRESIVAVARYVREPDPLTAEFAVVVADAWQGRGLGTLLMDRLERCAGDAGIGTLRGIILASNAPMLALMRARHYNLRPASGDPTLFDASIPLSRKDGP